MHALKAELVSPYHLDGYHTLLSTPKLAAKACTLLCLHVCLWQVGDHIIVDGGMCEFVVKTKAGPDVLAESIEQGLLLSRANLTFR